MNRIKEIYIKYKKYIVVSIAALLIYWLAIQKTVVEYRALNNNKELYDAYLQMESELNLLKQNMGRNIEEKERKTDVNSKDVRNSIVGFIEKHSDLNITIERFDGPYIYTDDDNTRMTETFNVMILKGDFESLMVVVDSYEREFFNSRLVSVKFVNKKNFVKNRRELYAELYFYNSKKS